MTQLATSTTTATRTLGARPAVRRLGLAARLSEQAPRTPVRVELHHPLRGERLLLRPLRAADRDAFIRLVAANRAHLARHCHLHHDGETDADLFERHLRLARAADRTGLAWRCIIELADGRLAGAVNLNDISRAGPGVVPSAELNYWIDADCAGQGHMTEALDLVLAHAMSHRGLGLRRILALITDDNEPSLRVARRHGFVREPGVGPVHLRIHGAWQAHRVYRRGEALDLPVAA